MPAAAADHTYVSDTKGQQIRLVEDAQHVKLDFLPLKGVRMLPQPQCLRQHLLKAMRNVAAQL